eukprot:GHVS01019174.1.p1 GENE.GHVS01019174.1~~GHVS01019174.1.p1  ORF type:complete len:1068 (-),score=194.80 GHVS01019174.1:109-3312(-)
MDRPTNNSSSASNNRQSAAASTSPPPTTTSTTSLQLSPPVSPSPSSACLNRPYTTSDIPSATPPPTVPLYPLDSRTFLSTNLSDTDLTHITPGADTVVPPSCLICPVELSLGLTTPITTSSTGGATVIRLGGTAMTTTLTISGASSSTTTATTSGSSSGGISQAIPCPPGTIAAEGNSPTPKQSGQRPKKNKTVAPTPNDSWKEILKLIEPYLDVEGMLMLRSCGRIFYTHKYKPFNNQLCFAAFRGSCPKVVLEKILPIAVRAVSATVRDTLRLDFCSNTLFKDASVARLMDAVHGEKATNCLLSNLWSLDLSFCYLVTDRGLAAILTTHLPYLSCLKLRCARSKQLTGVPLSTDLSRERWPSLTEFDCSFTNMWLEPVEVVAHFITANAGRSGQTPSLQMFGSWASKCFLEKIGRGSMCKTFCNAVKEKGEEVIAKLSKVMQKELLELSSMPEWREYPLIQLVKNSGSELLVNDPLTVNTREKTDAGEVTSGGVDVWTLPITTAIARQDHATFNTLLKRGAKVDVWDYLGKSPLFRACEVERVDFVEILIQQGASPIPHDLSGQSALEVAIRKKNVDNVRILLKHGALLNQRCPAIRQYKSPLYVACEVNSSSSEVSSSEIVQLFLEAGADPNWKSHTKFTPTMLAYQLNSAWLPHFIEAGAGHPVVRRWVLTEVMGCAVMKNDLESVKVLCSAYPDLLERAHQMWSKPHIQASKLGKFEILQYLLSLGADVNSRGENGQTALHDATEEGYLECVELLLDKGADLDVCDADGHNPLHIACLENRYDVAYLLLTRSDGWCGVNCRDKLLGETPLMICTRTRSAPMAELIMKYAAGIDCDIKDNQGRSTLTYAIFFGQYAVADFLMDRGADVTITDDAGNSPYTVVCERMLTQGSDKRVLKRYLRRMRLHKSKERQIKRQRPPQPPAPRPPSPPRSSNNNNRKGGGGNGSSSTSGGGSSSSTGGGSSSATGGGTTTTVSTGAVQQQQRQQQKQSSSQQQQHGGSSTNTVNTPTTTASCSTPPTTTNSSNTASSTTSSSPSSAGSPGATAGGGGSIATACPPTLVATV